MKCRHLTFGQIANRGAGVKLFDSASGRGSRWGARVDGQTETEKKRFEAVQLSSGVMSRSVTDRDLLCSCW